MAGRMTPPDDIWYDRAYASGDNSYYDNCKNFASGDFAGLFPEGWGQPGETPQDTTWENVTAGLWLPLFIPEGFEGDVPGSANPEVIIYAANSVPGLLDAKGAHHASPEVDQARWDEACRMAVSAASSTSGGAFARENP